MSHLDTWDPKPGRPTQGEFNPISTSVPGMQISEIFPKLSKQMHHAALVRSIAGTQGAHGRATYNVQTSYLPSTNLRHPGVGSVVVHELDNNSDLPPYITISGQARRAGYLGQRCEAYYVAAPGEKDPYLAFPQGIGQVRGDRRLEELAKMNKRFAVKRKMRVLRPLRHRLMMLCDSCARQPWKRLNLIKLMQRRLLAMVIRILVVVH